MPFIFLDETGAVTGTAENEQFEGQPFVDPADPRLVTYLLEEVRAAKRDEAMVEFVRRVALGVPFGGKTFQIDDASQAKINAVSTFAGLTFNPATGVSWPVDGQEWVAADNSRVRFMSAAEFLGFALSALATYNALFFACRTIKDAIAAATDRATLDAIDVSAGWPDQGEPQ